MTTHRTEHVALFDIELAEQNPKRHELDRIKRSIQQFGYVAPAIRDERTGRLVAGNGRTAALREMHDAGPGPADKQWPPRGVRVDDDGAWLVPVTCGWSSANDTEASAYLVADNRHTELGGWDNTELADMLQGIRDNDGDGGMTLLHAAGYTDDELADLVKLMEPIDLDSLGDDLGDPDPADMWPTVSIKKVPPHVAASWRSHLDTFGGSEVEAFAALLEVDPETPPVSDWKP